MRILSSFKFSQPMQKIISKPAAIIQEKLQQDLTASLKNAAVSKIKLDNATKNEPKELYEKEKSSGSRTSSGGINEHGSVLNAGIYEAFKNTAKQADEIKTFKDYLDIASMYEGLSKEEGLSKDMAQHYSDIVDNIKLYVAQEASNNRPIDSRLVKDSYLGNIDGQTKGEVGNVILPLTGDYSREALGLEELAENYKNYSIQEMKDILSLAENKLVETNKIIAELYSAQTGKAAVYVSKYQKLSEENFDSVKYTLADALVAMTNANSNGQLHRDFGAITLDNVMTEQQFHDRYNDSQILSKALQKFKEGLTNK